jgi:nitroreductase
MDVHEALYTTRAMRRVRPDAIPAEAQARILDAAIRAPSGGNTQGWRFLLVDDPEVKGRLAPLYRRALTTLWETFYKDRLDAARANPQDEASATLLRIQRSSDWLADHFAEVPLFLFAFVQRDPTGGSIYPAVWSAQLAARAEGIGSAITSVLGVFAKDEVLDILAVPRDEGWINACCVSFGYPTGRWGVAGRRPVHEVAARNSWDGPLGFEAPAPLWPRD